MTTDIKKGKTATLRMEPPSRWAGAITGQVLSDQGVELESVVPVLDSVSTTVVADAESSTTRLKLADIAGIIRGSIYEVASDLFGVSRVEVSAVDDDALTVTLVDPLPSEPEAGDAFRGFEIAFAIGTDSTSALGKNLRAIASHGGEEVEETFHVVVHPWTFPISTREIREYMAEHWRSDPRLSDERWVDRIRAAAEEELRGRLSAAGRYPHLHFNRTSLRRSAWPCVYRALLMRSRVPRGRDPNNYSSQLNFDIRDAVADLLKSLNPYDANEDDKVGADEVGPFSAIVRTR